MLLKTDEQYQKAVDELTALLEKTDRNSDESDRLDLLSLLIQDYEEKTFPSINELPDPIDAIKFRMEQQELEEKDMIEYIGTAGDVFLVLNRKKHLTLDMIRKLHAGLEIGLDILIQEYDL